MDYKIKLKRNPGIPKLELLDDLKEVGEKIGKSPTMDEYERFGKFKRGAFKRRFGSWNNALIEAGFLIIKRGNNTITEDMLLSNIASVWEKIGKQPSQGDLDDKSLSNFCSSFYKRRFGTYNQALLVFQKWIRSASQLEDFEENKNEKIKHFNRTKRDVNLRLRYLVMKRDSFKCKQDGWSPAIGTGRVLEVDHVIPWSKGGETVMENLQTLCSFCNRGKSNLE